VVACMVLAMLAALLNAIVNPYLLFDVPRIAGFNARKPAVDTQERLMKTYDVLRAAPNTLILGSSMVDLGLDAQHPAWPPHDRPVYNGALAGGGPYSSYRYLQHVMSRRHVALVMLGLDFQFFLTVPDYTPVTPEFESRLAVRRDGSINVGQRWQHLHDLFQGTISLDALTDSVATLAANLNGESSDLAAGNWDSVSHRRLTAAMGSFPLVVGQELFNIRRFSGKQINPLVMADVRAILDLCESHGTRVILFINPTHAEGLEILDLLGYWPMFEGWKRELVTLAARYPAADGHSRITLWDFSGYDSYSTEAVPMDRHAMHLFWDCIHYTRTLGDAIVTRMFGAGDGQFGVLLTPETLESRLTAIREQQRLYRERHPAAVRRVQNLYDSATGTPSRAPTRIQ
jgi:hypothetical protein